MARLTARAAGLGTALFDVAEITELAGYDPNSSTPPLAWPDFSGGIPTEFCCPRCAYSWRGNPIPNGDDAKVTEE